MEGWHFRRRSTASLIFMVGDPRLNVLRETLNHLEHTCRTQVRRYRRH